MKNKKIAEKITLVITDFTILLFLFLSIFCYKAVDWYITLRQYVMSSFEFNLCFVMSLISGILAVILLLSVHIMLYNIIKDKIFVKKNSLCFKIISICSIAICLAYLVILIKCKVFIALIVVVVCLFVSLIAYVIYKFMENAIKIKEENDFTI